MTDLRRPELLDPARHDRSRFDSGERTLDDRLRRYAGRNRRRDTAATWIIATPDDRVIAYASLAMTAIDRSAAPRAVAKQAPDPVPALLLGRLAVDKDFAGLGIGTALVAYVLATAIELNAKAACRAVVVAALDARARAWWERLGFHPFHPDDPTETDLYLLTTEIEATRSDWSRSRHPTGSGSKWRDLGVAQTTSWSRRRSRSERYPSAGSSVKLPPPSGATVRKCRSSKRSSRPSGPSAR